MCFLDRHPANTTVHPYQARGNYMEPYWDRAKVQIWSDQLLSRRAASVREKGNARAFFNKQGIALLYLLPEDKTIYQFPQFFA